MQLAIIGYKGVITEDTEDNGLTELPWRPIRGSLEAIARLHRAGWRIIVMANQPCSGSTVQPDRLAHCHAQMRRHIIESGGMLDAIFYCPHTADSHCDCHLPAPGLLQDIAGRLHVSPTAVPVIGDSLDYVRAATAVGAHPCLVKTGRGFGTVSSPELDASVPVFDDLYSAVDRLLHQPSALEPRH